MKAVRIGSRASRLALFQAEQVASLLKAKFQLETHIVPIVTTGDKLYNKALYDIGGKGLFLKEIEEALQNNVIDIAVHSLKDMPGALGDGLMLAGVLERKDPRDALISKDYYTLDTLPINARVGTSSSRRRVQLLRIRPDLQILPCRGNVETRIAKMRNGEFDAIILAYAGLLRLNLADLACAIDTGQLTPAPGQGVIALEVHKDNQFALDLCSAINHQPTWQIIQGERGFVEALNSSCKTPLAAFSELDQSSGNVKLQYMLSDFEGNFFLFKMMVCPLAESYEYAIGVAQEFTILMDEATKALNGLA